MTAIRVRLALRNADVDANRNQASGAIQFRPTSRRVDDGDVILPKPFTQVLRAGDEPPIVSFEQDDAATWAWQVLERVSAGRNDWTTFTVSDVTPAEAEWDAVYCDLTLVDPESFTPLPDAPPTVGEAIEAESDARESADIALQEAIGAEATARTDAINDEALTRFENDNALAADIAAETAARAALEASLPGTYGADAVNDPESDLAVALNGAYATVFGVAPGDDPTVAYAALVTAGGGELRFLPGAHELDDFTLNVDVPTLVTGRGATIAPAGTGSTAITVHTVAEGAQAIVLENVEIDAGGNGGDGLCIIDTYGVTFREVYVRRCDTGLLLTDEAYWSESTNFDGLYLEENMVGIDVVKNTGTGSFRYARWGRVHIDKIPSGGIGWRVGTGAQMAFSSIQLIECHTPNTNVTEFYLDGNMQGARVKMHAEGTNATTTRYAVVLGANANLDGSDFSLSIGGTGFAQDILNASSVVYQVQGYKKGSDVLASGDTSRVYQVFQLGNAKQRFHIAGDGSLAWGDGTNDTDTTMYRIGASQLRLDAELNCRRGASGNRVQSARIIGETQLRWYRNADGAEYFTDGTNAADVERRRSGAGTMWTNAEQQVERGAFGNPALSARVTGDTNARTAIVAGGPIDFGTGAAAADVRLYRRGTNTLGMDTGDHFQLDGTWNGGTLRLGSYYLWVDGSGRLRVKSSAPSSDTDGTVVGTQS